MRIHGKIARLEAAWSLLSWQDESLTIVYLFLGLLWRQAWTKRWTESSKWKTKDEMGAWKLTAGDWYGDETDKGIQTSEDARFYGLSAALEKPLVSEGKDLVIQYSVKHEQNLDCGGAYIKLMPGGKKFKAADFGGDTAYAIMFGPDICGSSNKKTHVILAAEKKKDNLLIKKDIPCETDDLTHLYTLVIRPDNTFEVFVDDKSVRAGKLDEEFDFLEPEEILDPEAKKPEDWVDEAMIPDPAEKMPDGWDDIPKEIADPEAKKPDDWDDEDDGEWEAPMLDNPEYQGEWQPTMIDNPAYKGKWVHPKVKNPDYAYDPAMYKVCGKEGCTHVGFELWQVTAGTLFDDIIVTDSLDEARAFAKETFFKKKEAEKDMYDEIMAEKRAKEEEEMGNMEGMEGMEGMDFGDMDFGDMEGGMDGMYDDMHDEF
jgi:calreticulin